MCMPGQQQIEPRVGSLPVGLWRVGQQDRELIVGHRGGGLFDVVDPVEVRVVDAGQEYVAAASLYYYVLVQQHPDPHPFDIRDHLDRVVIPKDATDIAPDNFPQTQHLAKTGLKRAEGPTAIVPCQNAKVVPQAADESRGLGHGICAHVGVQIAEVQDCEAFELRGKPSGEHLPWFEA